jgi:hypothetical protein
VEQRGAPTICLSLFPPEVTVLVLVSTIATQVSASAATLVLSFKYQEFVSVHLLDARELTMRDAHQLPDHPHLPNTFVAEVLERAGEQSSGMPIRETERASSLHCREHVGSAL